MASRRLYRVVLGKMTISPPSMSGSCSRTDFRKDCWLRSTAQDEISTSRHVLSVRGWKPHRVFTGMNHRPFPFLRVSAPSHSLWVSMVSASRKVGKT